MFFKKKDKTEELDKPKTRFFSRDPHQDIVSPLKESGRGFKSELKKAREYQKNAKEIENFSEFCVKNGLNGADEEAVEYFRRRCAVQAWVLFAAWLACVTLFVLSVKDYGFSVLRSVQYALLFSAITAPMLVFFWKNEVLGSKNFISFREYVLKLKFLFSFALVFAYAGVLHVAPAIAATIDLPDTKIANPSDLSSRFVGQIIGEHWAEMGGNVLASGLPTIINPILNVLNMGALVFVSVFCVYIFAMGSVTIAHTGEWKDSQVFSTFWSPLRTTAALALCAPLPSGVSLLQNLILVALAMSINLANNVSTVFFDYLEKGDGLTMGASVSTQVDSNYDAMFTAALTSLVIQHTATSIFGVPLKIPQVYTHVDNMEGTGGRADDYGDNSDGFGQSSVTIKFTPPSRSEAGDMPTLIIKPASDKAQILARAYQQALAEMVDTMNTALKKYLSGNVSERGVGADIKDLVMTTHKQYSKTIMAGQQALVNSLSGREAFGRDIVKNMVAQSKVYGWVSTGMYPFAIARAQGSLSEETKVTVTSTGANWDKLLLSSASQKTPETSVVDSLFREISTQFQQLRAQGTYTGMLDVGQGRPGASDSPLSMIWGVVADFVDKKAVTSLVTNMKESNPLAVLFSMGQWIIGIGTALITAVGAASGAAEGARAAGTQLGSGIPFIGGLISGSGAMLTHTVTGGLLAWKPLMITLGGIILTFGLACCYLLPVIPIIFWIRAVTSWAINVVETMMAAPFWAAAHVLPEGIGLAGQHARRGYLMLLDMFIRPTLLVCGAIISVMLMSVLGTIIVEILGVWAIATNQAGSFLIGTLVIVASMLYIMSEFIKYLFIQGIGVFPEKVLTWIGGQGNDMGARDAAGSASTFGGSLTGAQGRVASRMTDAKRMAASTKSTLTKGGKA